jgi:hypothetical protein
MPIVISSPKAIFLLTDSIFIWTAGFLDRLDLFEHEKELTKSDNPIKAINSLKFILITLNKMKVSKDKTI